MPVGKRIRTLRETKKLSLRLLASAAGVSPATLSLIESGQTSPSVATLEKIADGLGANIAAFFIDKQEEEVVELFSLTERPSIRLKGKSTLTPLASHRHRTGFEPILVRLEPGGKFNDDLYWINSSHAYAWVRHGSVVLKYEGKSFTIHETHSVYYDPRKPHNWLNPSKKDCELLVVRSL
ncbi:MAG: helix-turn-helix domain-containing protein [Nitrospinota bacterium]